MSDIAEKSALVVLSGVTVTIIGHLARIIKARGRNRGLQDSRDLDREQLRAKQESQLRDDLMLLVGELRAKETEHQGLIDVLREQLRKAEDNLDKQRRAKHDILSEVSHLSMTVQLYRMSDGGQIDGDNIDLNRLADICKTGD